MAFIPGYIHDIFVSYAHVDDQPLPGADRGWVSNLVAGIRIMLGQKLGRQDAFDLWIDHNLANNVRLTSQIVETLRGSAIIIVVLSPGYVASEWCTMEKETFRKVLADKRLADSRFFVVERDRVDDAERPVEFRELTGYRFWEIGPDDKKTRIFGEPKPDPSDRRYYDRLGDLCFDIVNELHRLKKVGIQTTPLTVHDAGNSERTVFLAESTDDLEEERDEVRRYLMQHEIHMLPQSLYNRDGGVFRTSVEHDLQRSAVFVQLLSGIRGKIAVPENRTFTQIQFDCARQMGMPILQWRSRDLSVESVSDQEHRALLCSENVMAISLEEFKRCIVDRIHMKPAMKSVERRCDFVFVIQDPVDSVITESICGCLDRFGVEYVLSLNDGRASDIRKDRKENILECDKVIFVYGHIEWKWVREQILNCRKIASRSIKPLKALAVFEGPPETKTPLGLKLSNLQIINCRTGMREHELREFIHAC